ncbi:threonine/serine dehydratase [Phytohabitans flavus]|uniref:Threonine dehydratase n=1 Tax=Phytohabitans flavus TaxID=1076124 RepID=A0A6F8XXR8_9ACTN|nr:serine/threonine dehydratase [Phytohabitans flavus]BCB78521.1 threonine dehydratase [Phytohabitans flavus]
MVELVLPVAGDVAAAAGRIAPYVRRTPVYPTVVDGRPVTFKLEHLQLTGSFKVRGALNALLGGGLGGAVVTASGGNHGIGVATAAARLGTRATIYVPETVPPDKAARIAATGAEVVRHGSRYAEAEAAARAFAETQGLRYLPAYDDPEVVAGQGTIALEIATQAPECDTVGVAVGGGGLISGIALASAPGTTIVGVEPENCACLHAAIAAGEPVDSPVDSIAASALGATRLGRIPHAILRDANLHLALVEDKRILAARDRLWDEFRLAVEPAAAAPFAAWLAGEVPGDHPCLVLCGANAPWTAA